ncbi:MAG TPA: hypothetical protein VN028_03965 [Rhodocyclaceae bacterium]|nr:hypothetical protein [Rhodocyclaceae bacterium]
MNYPTEMQQKMASASAYSGQILGAGALSQHGENPSRPSTEIEGCLSRANNALERLHGRISAVEDRMRPVLRGVALSGSASNGKPQEALSPLGDALTSIENRIDSAVDRLEALLLSLAL